jgi:hypothetical protein
MRWCGGADVAVCRCRWASCWRRAVCTLPNARMLNAWNHGAAADGQPTPDPDIKRAAPSGIQPPVAGGAGKSWRRGSAGAASAGDIGSGCFTPLTRSRSRTPRMAVGAGRFMTSSRKRMKSSLWRMTSSRIWMKSFFGHGAEADVGAVGSTHSDAVNGSQALVGSAPRA